MKMTALPAFPRSHGAIAPPRGVGVDWGRWDGACLDSGFIVC
jgi:hypothetical protein